jgi:hypothetical protein
MGTPATRIELKGARERYLIVHEELAAIEERYAKVNGGPIAHAPVWGYGQHDPEPVMLRRDEIKRMGATVARGEQGVHLEQPNRTDL